MTIQANFPNVQPSLLLDFANAKQLPPSVTFTRATTATYYNGSTTAMAEQNMLQYSQQFDNAYWSAANSTIIANTTTAPDGTSTADKLAMTTQANYFSLGVASPTQFSFIGGQTYTLSVYMKSDPQQFGFLGYYDNAFRTATFDLTNGTSNTSSGVGSASIINVGNGWYRCTFTFTPTVTNGSFVYLGIANNSSYQYPSTFNGTNGNGIFFWGAQVEQRSTATAYTATTNAPVTNYIPVLLTAGGGQPRFDHNPTTSVSLGLAIEPQRTNLMVRSEEFDSGSWTKYNGAVITPNIGVAPNGTLSADLITASTNNNFVGCYQSGAGSTSMSVYAKAAGKSWFMFIDTVGNAGSAWFNLTTGTVGTVLSGYTAAMTSVGNGWYRISVTAGTGSFAYWQFAITDSDNSTSVTANSVNGILLWGAQGEVGSFPTSYIATTSAAATRAAETVTMSTADTAAILDIAQGVMLVEATLPPTGGYDIGTFACGIGYSSTDYLGLLYAGTGYFQPTHGGFGPTPSTEVGGTLNKGALSWNGTSGAVPAAYAQNGQVSNTGNGTGGLTCFAKFPNLTYLSIGYAAFDTALANRKKCWIGKVAVYPQAATSAQLQALTA